MKVFEGAGEADEKLSKYGTITTSEFYDQQVCRACAVHHPQYTSDSIHFIFHSPHIPPE